MAVAWMFFLVVLQRLELFADVANLGVVAFGFGHFKVALVFLDVLVDGFHGSAACPGRWQLAHHTAVERGCQHLYMTAGFRNNTVATFW